MKDDDKGFWFQGRDPKRVAEDEAEMNRLLPQIVRFALLVVAIVLMFGFV